jgi:hypothetical protein
LPKGVYIRGKRGPNKGPTKCAVCNHAERHRIEMLSTAGQSLEKLAQQFGLHKDCIWRHMQRHVTDDAKAGYLVGPSRLAKLIETAAIENGSVIDYYGLIRSILVRQLTAASDKGDAYAASAVARVLNDTLRELGRVTGQVTQLATTQISITNNHLSVINSQPFAELQSGLLRVCSRHPDARQDIIALFRELDAKYAGAAPMKTINPPTLCEAVSA